MPQVHLNLVGAEPAAQVLSLGSAPGVRVLGHVADLNAALNDAAVFVAPLRFAAGVQNKVLEAMAAELPVVTTSYVNAGLEAEHGKHLIVADDADQISEAILALLRDPQERRRLGRAGRNFVLQNYRWEDVLNRVNAIEEKIAPA